MEPRDVAGSISTFNAPQDIIMAPPNGTQPTSQIFTKPPPPNLTQTITSQPNGFHYTSQTGPSCNESISPPEVLMAPPDAKVKLSDHLSPSTCTELKSHSTLPPKPSSKALFFPVIDSGHATPSPLSGSSDLLSLFNVSYMYDKFVRPYLKPTDTVGTNMVNGTSHGDLKGKGKAEVVMNGSGVPDSSAPKRMKMEKSYGHFVADVGGRNSIKKDHQLSTWIMDPNFQESSIPNFLKPLPTETLAQAFTLQAGVLPGFDTSVWIAEEGGPKRKRKKRKQGEMTGTGETVPPSNLPNDSQSHQTPSSQPRRNGENGHHSNHPNLSKEEDHRKKKRTKLSNGTLPG